MSLEKKMQKSSTNNTTKFSKRRGVRGRKSPSNITRWDKRFRRKLRRFHKHFAKKTFHRLMKKSSTLRSTLKRRSKEYEVEFEISLDQIRELFWRNYNTKCRYCKNRLDVANMVCDHYYPLSMGGGSTVKNLQIICGRCNTRKGPLTDRHFRKILKW